MVTSCTSDSMSRFQYYIFNKPFDVLSQFTQEVPSHRTLKDFLDLPNDVYPVGRLDRDSEGLLLLTNDNQFKTRLLDPKSRSTKTYWAQVDGDVDQTSIEQMAAGVDIKLKKARYKTLPAKVKKIVQPILWDRVPPIRFRKEIPTTWLQIQITEGKNRQVRKMCAAIGHPCLRLVRYAIKGVQLEGLDSGQYRVLTEKEIKELRAD